MKTKDDKITKYPNFKFEDLDDIFIDSLDMKLLEIVEDENAKVEKSNKGFGYVITCENAKVEVFDDNTGGHFGGHFIIENRNGVFINCDNLRKGRVVSPKVGVYFFVETPGSDGFTALWHYYDPEQIEYVQNKGLDIKTVSEDDINSIGISPSEQVETEYFPSIGELLSLATGRKDLAKIKEEQENIEEIKIKILEMKLKKTRQKLKKTIMSKRYAISESKQYEDIGDLEKQEKSSEKARELNKRIEELQKDIEGLLEMIKSWRADKKDDRIVKKIMDRIVADEKIGIRK